jgi:predicted HD phosphohydrolase
MTTDTFKNTFEAASVEGKAKLLIEFISNEGLKCFEENITQYAHATQSAFLARTDGASNLLITAALLHDIGHLFVTDFNESNYNEEDHYHENLFVEIFKGYFPQIVLDTVSFHVLAKRYLVTVEEGYYENLSDASKNSFHVQGGYLSKDEIKLMEGQPFLNEILMLRRWDESAKEVNLIVPPVEEYYNEIVEALENKIN